MTELKCMAESCVYNEEKYCCKGDILVEGQNATEKKQTCCGSFKPRGEGSARNSLEHPSHNIEIDCEAKNCCYNEDCKCSAPTVGIGGEKACTCGETECCTFTKR